MSTNVGPLGDKKLFVVLLVPSWLSGFMAVTISVLLVIIAVLLTRFGSGVEQSLLGLGHVYTQSGVGTKVSTVDSSFASNSYLNDVLLFLLWGSVGLMVYSVVQGIVKEFRGANDVILEMRVVKVNRPRIIQDALLRSFIKIVAFIAWWVVFRYAVYTLTPFALDAARMLAINPTHISDWGRCILAVLFCVLTLHVLTILMRLAVLRPRIFSAEIEA